GNDTKLRTRLHGDGIDYVLSIGPECDVFDPSTIFTVPERKPRSRGPAPTALATETQPRPINELVAGLDPEAFGPVAFRDIDGGQLVSRFAFVRVIAAHPRHHLQESPPLPRRSRPKPNPRSIQRVAPTSLLVILSAAKNPRIRP